MTVVISIEGSGLVPSVVSLDPDSGEFIVGQRAKRRSILFPDYTVKSIKRLMGKDTKVHIGSQELSPEEISSKILNYIKTQGEKSINEPIDRVVITVPAYFNDAQRRATIKAGEMAGLDVVRIINEPTAASLVYEGPAEAASSRQHILIYDLGGGTFDVSVLRIQGEVREVLSSRGNTQLGGDDFDRKLLDYVLDQLRIKEGVDLSKDRRAVARLSEAVEEAKIGLSTRPFVKILEPGLAERDGRPINLNIEISRSTFESLIEEFIDSTFYEVKHALEEASLEPEDLDKVILVGGSSYIPAVIEGLKMSINFSPELAVDPELCVALGAAVQGGIMAGEIFDQILVDVAAHSLGIRAFGREDDYLDARPDTFAPIIPRNTPIPVTRADVFYTMAENQKMVLIDVFQGESDHCSQNESIDSFNLSLRPSPIHCEIVVEFSYDLDGIIHVVADQKGYDNRKEVTMSVRERGAGGVQASITEDYLQRKAKKLLEAKEIPEDDPARKQLVEALDAYSKAKDSGGTEEDLDTLEEDLLDAIEEAEED
ncbi:MAG: Hsp70 family protein [Nitrospiraceae bacterium]|nr:Hsp70 family protein [Nitrospiraceae bacterium]